jgi:hypothetical protein
MALYGKEFKSSKVNGQLLEIVTKQVSMIFLLQKILKQMCSKIFNQQESINIKLVQHFSMHLKNEVHILEHFQNMQTKTGDDDG